MSSVTMLTTDCQSSSSHGQPAPFTEAMQHFVEDPTSACPVAVRADYILLLADPNGLYQGVAATSSIGQAMFGSDDDEDDAWMRQVDQQQQQQPPLIPPPEMFQDQLPSPPQHANNSPDERLADYNSLVDSGLNIQQLKKSLATFKEQPQQQQALDNSPVDVSHLNSGQRQFYNFVFNAVVHENRQVLVDLSGGAGVGKTTSIEALQANINHHCGQGSVRIAAPTGGNLYTTYLRGQSKSFITI